MPVGDIGKRIKTAREAMKPVAMKVGQLAKALGVSPQRLSNWENGKHDPQPELVAEIASVLGVRIEWLLKGTGAMNDHGHSNAKLLDDRALVEGFVTTAAIRSWKGALAGFNGEECYFEEDGIFEVPIAFLVGGISRIDLHDVVRVSGMSMAPRVVSGDLVIVFRDETLIRNSIVLASSPEGKVYLKVLRHMNDRWELASLGKGDHFADLSGWRIHGYAVTIIRTDDEEPGPNVEWRSGKPLKA